MSLFPTLYDRVVETTVTTGTGALTLAGAVAGYQSFGVVGDGNSAPYALWAVDANGTPTGDWEVGYGTYTLSGTTLSRDTILSSSNAGSVVNLSAGTKRVALVRPANHQETVFPGVKLTPIVNGSYSWLNQNSSTWTQTGIGWTLAVPAQVSANVSARLKSLAFANTYTATALIIPTLQVNSSSQFGLVLKDSGSANLVTLGFYYNGTNLQVIGTHYNSVTSFGAFFGSGIPIWPGSPLWARIVDDNTNRRLSFSLDGINFYETVTENRTNIITPNQIGFFIDPNGQANNSKINIVSFTETSP